PGLGWERKASSKSGGGGIVPLGHPAHAAFGPKTGNGESQAHRRAEDGRVPVREGHGRERREEDRERAPGELAPVDDGDPSREGGVREAEEDRGRPPVDEAGRG